MSNARHYSNRAGCGLFDYGIVSAGFVAELKSRRISWFATATTVAEAKEAEAAGADVIIAQGMEAGGHRGAFDAAKAEQQLVGLFALVPAIVDAVRIPVVAAGGIADGRGVAAALTLGASAVVIGTAFLRCPETNVPSAWADALAKTAPEQTILKPRLQRQARSKHCDRLRVRCARSRRTSSGAVSGAARPNDTNAFGCGKGGATFNACKPGLASPPRSHAPSLLPLSPSGYGARRRRSYADSKVGPIVSDRPRRWRPRSIATTHPHHPRRDDAVIPDADANPLSLP